MLMKITLITVGEPHLSFAKEGIAEYHKRIGRFADVDLIFVKENKKTDATILKHMEKKFCVLLDEKGKEYSSQGLARFLERHKNQGSQLCFLIGDPDGHSDAVREQAQGKIALSQLTFPHDLATMLTLETLYRSLSILEGHPYHRD
jgi:23S rRNA (pseudouridine1915-N3)-methyltransferase